MLSLFLHIQYDKMIQDIFLFILITRKQLITLNGFHCTFNGVSLTYTTAATFQQQKMFSLFRTTNHSSEEEIFLCVDFHSRASFHFQSERKSFIFFPSLSLSLSWNLGSRSNFVKYEITSKPMGKIWRSWFDFKNVFLLEEKKMSPNFFFYSKSRLMFSAT